MAMVGRCEVVLPTAWIPGIGDVGEAHNVCSDNGQDKGVGVERAKVGGTKLHIYFNTLPNFSMRCFSTFFFLFLSTWFCFLPEALKMEAIFKAPTWYMHSKQKAENRPWASEWKKEKKWYPRISTLQFLCVIFFFILTTQYPNVNHTISWYVSQPHCRGGYLPSPQRKSFLPCWVFCWSFEGKPKRQPNTQLLVRTLSVKVVRSVVYGPKHLRDGGQG